MSFILDAIAKSEQERQQQEVPAVRVLALPAKNVQQPRRVLPYFVVGALLLNAALFVLWMQSGQTLFNLSSPTQVEFSESENEQASVPDNAAFVSPTTAIGIAASTPISEVIGEIENTASMNESIAEQRSVPATSTSEAVAGLLSGSETAQSNFAVTTTGENTTAKKPTESAALSNNTRSGESAERGAVPVQVMKNTDRQREVSSLSELPRDVRDDLPTVVFSGHLYSSDPASRFVFINEGRPVRRGGQIADELFLHEITPTGVIVEFRGYLIDIGVLQNWTLN